MILMILYQYYERCLKDWALGESLNSGLQAQNNLHAKGPTARSIIPGSHQDDRRRTNGYQSFQGFLEEIQGLGLGGEDKKEGQAWSQRCFSYECNPILWKDMCSIFCIYTAVYTYVLCCNIHVFGSRWLMIPIIWDILYGHAWVF